MAASSRVRRLATVPAALVVAMIAGCATFNSEPVDHTVTFEITHALPATTGTVTLWVNILGQYDQLGTVGPGRTAAFTYQLRRTGTHRLVAYRPGYTNPTSRDATRPPGQLIASSDGFALGTDVRRVRWSIDVDLVLVDRAEEEGGG